MNYDKINKLNDLRKSGAITEEEFQREKQRLLNGQSYRTKSASSTQADNRTLAAIIHLAQLLPGPGWIVSIVIWLSKRDEDNFIDENGKVVINWIVTSTILFVVFGILCVVAIGIPFVIALAICNLVFIIIGGIKAADGITWRYPFSFRILA